MKFLASLLILVGVVATVLSLSVAGRQVDPPRVGKPVGANLIEKYMETLDTNNLGELVINLIHNLIADLGDPYEVITDEISIPIFLEDIITVSGEVNVSNVKISGISNLNITDSIATILPIGGTFGFHLPEIVVSGDYNIELLVTSIFPIPLQGAGPFSIRLTETTLNTIIKLKALLNGHLAVNTLSYDVDIYQIWTRIDGLFSDLDDGQLNEAFNTVLNSYVTILFDLFEAQLHDQVVELVTLVADDVLGNLTLADIIDLINQGGKTTTTTTALPMLKH